MEGERILREYPAEYVFYYTSPSGSYRSIFGDPLKRYSTGSGQAFKRELLKKQRPEKGPAPKIFESDINPVFRLLADHYRGCELPDLHVCFFDIETEFDPSKGFAPTTDPFAKVTAISLVLGWTGTLISLILAPPSLTPEQAQAIGDEYEDTYVFQDEADLLDTFLSLIEDADVLTGWNSEGFDIPYMVNRVERVLGKPATRRFCLWNELPREREYEKFKKLYKTYDLVGRVHLDYLLLYQKHNTQQLHSYRLDYVGEIEVGENKIPFEGTFDTLWKDEFSKFIAYSRQDTLLLPKIDEKRKFIQLANQIAHGNSVLLKTTMGSVALVEQAIINDMHDLGMIAPDRKRKLREQHIAELIEAELGEDDDGDGGAPAPVVGAYVANPKIGIHREVACTDINSLYPNAIRALNMSVETIFGQLRPDETKAYIAARVAELGPKKRAEAWDGLFHTLEFGHLADRDGGEITLDLEDGTTRVMTGAQLYDYIFNPANNLCISANGTLFRTDRDGLIPTLLGKWYAERKGMQHREKSFSDILAGLEIPPDLATDLAKRLHKAVASNETADLCLLDLIKAGDVERMCQYMSDNKLTLKDGKIVPDNPEAEKRIRSLESFWNQRQQSRKILLNSLYGALLNEACRFYDARLGQSTTLNGRMIVRHMNAKVNEVVTGSYDYRGEAIVYADTDSCYFSAYHLWKNIPELSHKFDTREATIELYDDIAEVVNASFPQFMMETFNCSHTRGSHIKAGRELVASSALFIKKKKYACLMYDKDNFRLDVKGKPGKLKAMGLDLKRADTPKYMQKFLEKLLMDLLTGAEREKMYEDIKQFRKEFIAKPGWEKGTPKKVNALSVHTENRRKKLTTAVTTAVDAKAKRSTVPPHVQAAINYNELRKFNSDLYSMEINDGSKVVVCKLRPNVYNMLTVAYPIDEPHLPKWYKDLPFDHALMEETIIDNKLNNLVGVLNWDLSMTKERDADDVFVFA